MEEIAFRRVTEAELAPLEEALAALSADLGDAHAPQQAQLARAVLGPAPSAHGLLAVREGRTMGAALFSPVYSTVRAAAGVHVSDLWVAPQARGHGLGRALLAEVARAGAGLWAADWLKLAVYDHSRESQAFYRRLGFHPADGMQEMRLDAGATAALIGRAG
jgi:ribosomal protein S18 acetylase RimI-like enzyme